MNLLRKNIPLDFLHEKMKESFTDPKTCVFVLDQNIFGHILL